MKPKKIRDQEKLIKEKKHLEEVLRSNDLRYKALTEHSPVGIFSTDATGSTDYVNPRWCEISRVSASEALGDGWLNKVHPDDRKALFEVWQKAVQEKRTSRANYRFLHSDGSITWVTGLAAPQIDPDGKIVGYIGTIIDISELKEKKKALTEKEEKYRTLFEGANDAIFIMHKDKFIDCNQMTVSMFGCRAKEDIIGHHPWNFSPAKQPDGTDSLKKATSFIEAANNGLPQRFYWKHCRLNGEEFDTEISLNRILVGEHAFIQALVRDVTDRVQAEHKLLRAKEKAEESDRLKTAFLHNISHEIRTPLNAIIGFSALLGEPDVTDETRRSFVDYIMNSSNHLLAIVNDILEISNIEAGILKLNNERININSLLKKIYGQFNPVTIEKGLQLECSSTLSEIEAKVHTDKTKLIEVLSNLISNAIKFTDHGRINFGCTLKKDYIEFYVSDTGIGIPREHHEKIFNRFFQADSSKSRVHEGTGLGLSISKAYIEFMGGNIWVVSDRGQGSAFYFTIPYVKDEVSE